MKLKFKIIWSETNFMFPGCGDCESNPCHCERNDDWYWQ